MTSVGIDVDTRRGRLGGVLAQRMPEHLARLGWDRTRLVAHQTERLRALLAHAQQCSPFHARRLAGIEASRFELADLASLPTMTKAEMMDHFDHVVTDRRLNRRVVDEHLANQTEASLLHDDYVCLASGGSSGRRGVFVQTVAEYCEFGASVMRRSVAAAQANGAPPGGLVIAFVAAASPIHSTGFAAAVASGPIATFVGVPVTLPLGEVVTRLEDLQPTALIGYPSKLAQLARERQSGRLRIAPRMVQATSELLTSEDRDTITAGFGVPVVDTFASTEGLVGHSPPGGDTLTFASDLCIAEPVDADNRPVQHGDTSAKVLVTNLHNFTQPLIRYELDDRFQPHPPGPDAHLRANVDGRADSVFRYGSVEIHPIVVRSVLVDTPAVTDYQVTQTQHGIHLRAVATPSLDPAALASALTRALRHAGLHHAQATVQVVDTIEPHPETGKTRRFIPCPPRPQA
jgi:phenylacetate-CoA ligase